tara:strand:+ start:94 stop:834 length:741 start_codon:yes stop_codon:yes gene_type:complete
MVIKNIIIRIILIILVGVLIISNFITSRDTYINSDDPKYKLYNIFSTNIFDNKDIILIANNPKLSKETKVWLNNYDKTNGVIVRFNGYKKIVEDYANGITDVMIFRDIQGSNCSFHGIQNIEHEKKIESIFKRAKYNVLTTKINKMKNVTDYDKFYLTKKCTNQRVYTISTHGYRDLKGSTASWGLTSGFNFLLHLLRREKTINYKNIYLIGFTFHSKKDGGHYEKWEYEYFRDNIQNKYNVHIKL